MTRKGILQYVAGAAFFSAMQVMAYFLDLKYTDGMGWISIGMKTLIIVVCIFILVSTKAHFLKNHAKAQERRLCYAAMGIILILGFIAYARSLNVSIGFSAALAGILSVLTTAVWEELYYRAVAVQLLHEDRDRLSRSALILLTVVFSLSHGVNAINGDYLSAFLTVMLAAGFGFLLLAIYSATGSLILPWILHFMNNFISWFFISFSSNGSACGFTMFILLLIAMTVAGFVMGKKILSKHGCAGSCFFSPFGVQ